ncbi:hypothetical protein AcW1_008148 [Taiwanofungus camphoratus]|nr:hypothetical protein AcV5_008443 [Antrodia cinnamomea]KAI0950988.1 hypothetical protein AcW1_008148 [Antrodia cinnamomea]KAI0955892.1 hypothetical protein AcV7_006434 [Antrodia cinnamomea]
MSLLSNIVGFSLFGLMARVGQLAIKKRNIFENLGGHGLAMVTFGYAGYWAYKWDERAAVLLAEKRAQIAERRQREVAAA